MFQYFLKVRPVSWRRSVSFSRFEGARADASHSRARARPQVVSTKFEFLDGRALRTHQYSVTQYERDCAHPSLSVLAPGHARSRQGRGR